MEAQLTHRLTAYSLQKDNMLVGDTDPEGKARPSFVFTFCSSEAFKTRKKGKRGCPSASS